jgi:hypothetical protein
VEVEGIPLLVAEAARGRAHLLWSRDKATDLDTLILPRAAGAVVAAEGPAAPAVGLPLRLEPTDLGRRL